MAAMRFLSMQGRSLRRLTARRKGTAARYADEEIAGAKRNGEAIRKTPVVSVPMASLAIVEDQPEAAALGQQLGIALAPLNGSILLSSTPHPVGDGA